MREAVHRTVSSGDGCSFNSGSSHGHRDPISLTWDPAAGRKPGLLWETETEGKEAEQKHRPNEQVVPALPPASDVIEGLGSPWTGSTPT